MVQGVELVTDKSLGCDADNPRTLVPGGKE